MKAFARIDVIVQTLLIIAGLVMGLAILSGSIHSDYMFAPYFLVGGWQIFSVIVHLAGEGVKMNTLRKVYLIVLLVVIFIVIASIPSGVIYTLFGLLIFSPLMAFFYLYTCYRELKLYQQGKAAYDLKGQTSLSGNIPAAIEDNAEGSSS